MSRGGNDVVGLMFVVVATVATAIVVAPSVADLRRWGWPDVFGVIGLVAAIWAARRQLGPRLHGAASPTSKVGEPTLSALSWWAPLGLALAVVLVVFVRRGLEIPLLAAVCSGAAVYMLLGLWLSPAVWRGLWGPALLLVGTLPVGQRADEWLGLPARLAVAEVAFDALRVWNVPVDSSDTVLVFENGLTEVAAACAGLRGLWTAALLLIFVAALERRRIGFRFLAIIGGAWVLILLGNALRILALIVVAMQFDARPMAEVLHEPLGLTVFGVVMLGALMALRHWVPDVAVGTPAGLPASSVSKSLPCDTDSAPIHSSSVGASPSSTQSSAGALSVERTRLLSVAQAADVGAAVMLPSRAVGVAAAFASLAAVLTMQPVTSAQVQPMTIEWPSAFETMRSEPAKAEIALARSVEGGRIDKVRFKHGAVAGQALMLQARTWRAQHPPELCLRMGGHRITGARNVQVDTGHSARVLDIGGGRRMAAYWYQSRTKASPDLWTKVWSTWRQDGRRWVLVSILLDEGTNTGSVPRSTLRAIHDAVAAAFASTTATPHVLAEGRHNER